MKISLSLQAPEEGLCCGSRLRKGEVFAYVGRNRNLKDLKGRAPPPLSAELGLQLTQSRTLPGQPKGHGTNLWRKGSARVPDAHVDIVCG